MNPAERGHLAICLSLLVVLTTGCTVPYLKGPQPCKPQEVVDQAYRVSSEGAQLSLLVRGKHCRGPILLWLHGGPGGAETPLFRLYDGDLEQHFIVAYWDQRGAGQSYDADAAPGELTVERHLRDLDRVVATLHAQFHGAPIVLVGHSWGATLAIRYAHRYPDRIATVIAVNPLIAGLAAQQAQYRFALRDAQRRGDEDAIKAIAALGSPPLTYAQSRQLEAMVDQAGGYFHRRPNFLWVTLEGIVKGLIAPWDIPTYIHANEVSLKAMYPQLMQLDLRKQVRTLEVPIVFMLGRFDHQVSVRATEDFHRQLHAPSSSVIWFLHSAHNIPFEQPAAFMRAVIDSVANPLSVIGP